MISDRLNNDGHDQDGNTKDELMMMIGDLCVCVRLCVCASVCVFARACVCVCLRVHVCAFVWIRGCYGKAGKRLRLVCHGRQRESGLGGWASPKVLRHMIMMLMAIRLHWAYFSSLMIMWIRWESAAPS